MNLDAKIYKVVAGASATPDADKLKFELLAAFAERGHAETYYATTVLPGYGPNAMFVLIHDNAVLRVDRGARK